MDTLRADHLGTYGYERATSPHFDRFSSQGVQFTRAFSPTSWTLPGHASMLSGRNPLHHGAITWKTPIDEDVPLLAELLKERGYRTVGVVNGTFVKAGFGFDRGMDSYQFHKSQEFAAHQAGVLEVLDRGGSEPFFYFFHYMRVHGPYRPNEGTNPFMRPFDGDITASAKDLALRWERRGMQGPVVSEAERNYLVDLYDGAIYEMDLLLAEVLERLDGPGFENTYVILTSDHGEEFMDHESLGHGLSLYEEVISVPLLIRGPRIPAGERIDALAGLVDIVPTVLDLLEIPIPEGMDGQSLRASWEANADPKRSLLLRTSFVIGGRVLFGVRSNSAKLTFSPDDGHVEFYKLDDDPHELVSQPLGTEAETLKQIIESAIQIETGDGVSMSAEEIEQLRALGYLDLPSVAPRVE